MLCEASQPASLSATQDQSTDQSTTQSIYQSVNLTIKQNSVLLANTNTIRTFHCVMVRTPLTHF
jgi:hypothetical protein